MTASEGPTLRAARLAVPPAEEPLRHRVLIHAVSNEDGIPAAYVYLACSCGWTSAEFDVLSPAEAWQLEWLHLSSAALADAVPF